MESLLHSRTTTAVMWAAQIVTAAILLMTSISKLTSSSEAIALFKLLGVEPWGRFALGSAELVTATMLLWPQTAGFGGLVGLGLMTGAIATHLFRIGVMYNGDASLFAMALTVLSCSAITAYLRRPRRSE